MGWKANSQLKECHLSLAIISHKARDSGGRIMETLMSFSLPSTTH